MLHDDEKKIVQKKFDKEKTKLGNLLTQKRKLDGEIALCKEEILRLQGEFRVLDRLNKPKEEK